MKLLKITLMLALTIFTFESTFAADKEVKLQIKNMSCPSCPFIVKKTLQKVDGVKKVSVSYLNRTATVLFDDDKTSEDVLIKVTTDRGYPAQITK